MSASGSQSMSERRFQYTDRSSIFFSIQHRRLKNLKNAHNVLQLTSSSQPPKATNDQIHFAFLSRERFHSVSSLQ